MANTTGPATPGSGGTGAPPTSSDFASLSDTVNGLKVWVSSVAGAQAVIVLGLIFLGSTQVGYSDNIVQLVGDIGEVNLKVVDLKNELVSANSTLNFIKTSVSGLRDKIDQHEEDIVGFRAQLLNQESDPMKLLHMAGLESQESFVAGQVDGAFYLFPNTDAGASQLLGGGFNAVRITPSLTGYSHPLLVLQ